jgi:hypothetical protein
MALVRVLSHILAHLDPPLLHQHLIRLPPTILVPRGSRLEHSRGPLLAQGEPMHEEEVRLEALAGKVVVIQLLRVVCAEFVGRGLGWSAGARLHLGTRREVYPG